MKKLLFCSALLAAFPIAAADLPDTPAPPAALPASHMRDALSAAAKELEQNFGQAKGNPIPILDRLAAYEFTPATAQQLKTVFGPLRPYTLARAAAPAGMVGFDFAVPANNYADLDQLNWSWSALNAKLLLDSKGRTLSSSGSWPVFMVDSKTSKAVVNGITLDGKQRRNADDIWLGKARVEIESIDITGKAKSMSMQMARISVESSAVQRGKNYDVATDFRIQSIKAMEEQIDDVRMSMRISKLDLKAFEQLSKSFNKANKPGAQAQLADLGPQLKAFGKGMAARGSAIEINEISAGYLGHRAVIKGRIALAKAVDSDFDSFAALSKKIVTRFELRVPVALIGAVTAKVTKTQMAQKGEAASPEMIDAASKNVTDMAVGKMLTNGYARLDQGALVSTIEFKGGKLTVNGKPLAIPLPGVKAPAAAAPASPANQARPSLDN